MAKRQPPQGSDSSEIRQLLDGLYKIVQTTNATSKEQVRINRELLKTMAVLQSGFAKNEEDAKRLINDVKDGLEITDEYAAKWLKKLGASDDKVEDILDKFRDLEKVDMDLIDNAEDYLDLLEQQYDVLDDATDLTKRLLSNHDAIVDAIKRERKATRSLNGSVLDVEATLEQVVSKKVAVARMFDGMSEGIARSAELITDLRADVDEFVGNIGSNVADLDVRFNPLTGQIDAEVNKIKKQIEDEKNSRIDALKEYFQVNKKMQLQASRSLAATTIDVKFDVDTGDITTATGILQKGTMEYEQMIQQLDKIAQENSITDKLKVDFQKIIDLMAVGTNRTEDQETALKTLLTPLGLATKMMTQQVDLETKKLDLALSEVEVHKERYKRVSAFSGQMKAVDGIVKNVAGGFDHLNAIMPLGIGEFLGLSKTSAELIDSHNRGLKAMSEKLMDGADKADAMRSYYAELGPSITSTLSPMTILIASTALLYKFVSNITDKYKELSERMGTSLKQSQKLYQVQLDTLTSMDNQFATMDDLVEAQTAMVGSSGKIFELMDSSSQKLAVSLIEQGKAFGYGTEQAVELHKVFKRLGADDTLAENLQRNVALLSEAVGISPKVITQDLLDASEEVSIYFAGMPDKAAKAVVQVRRMGMSLKQAGAIAQKMLNLEGFMTDMYELQAMTGGGIDFSEAFDKGLMGDIEGMTESIMNNIGSTARFNSMDHLTRMKIANTLGMSVEDLAKSVKLREDMADLSKDEQKYLMANVDRLGDISQSSKDEVRSRLQQLQATDRMNVAWEKIKGTLVSALLPAVELIADGISSLSPLFDLVMIALKPIGFSLKISLQILRGFMLPIKVIASGIESVVGWVAKFTDGLGGAGDMMDKIMQAAFVFGGVIGTAFAVLKPKAFFGSILGGFGSLFKTVFSFVPALGSMFGGVFKIFGVFGKTAKANTDVATAGTENTATTSIQTTKSVAESAISHLADVATKAVEQVKNAASGVNTALSGVSASASAYTAPVTAATTAMVTDVKEKSKKAVKEVEVTAKATGDVVDKVATKSKGRFASLVPGKGVFKAIGAIGATTFATLAVDMAGSFFKGGEAGEEAVGNMVQSSMPMMGSIFAMAGPMLFSSLSEGFEKFIRKQLEGKFEEKLEPVLKSARKGMESIGKPAEKSLEKASERGSSLFGGMFNKIGKVAQKPLDAVRGLFGKKVDLPVEPKVIKPKDVLSDVVTDMVKEAPDVVPDVTEKVKKIKDAQLPGESVVSTKKPPEVPTIDETPIQKSERSIKKSYSSLTDTIKSAWSGFKSSVSDIIKFVIDTMKQVADGVMGVAKTIAKGVRSVFSELSGIIKDASKTMKSVLTDIVSIAETALKSLGRGIGEGIKGILKGIGDGLSSFKGNAIQGAAALVVLSGALWVTSKAMQNFAAVSWDDIAKGGVALVGLAGTAAVMGKMSGEMIKGALAIGILGASLIPAAFAFGMFNDVDWSALAVAGVAIIGLATVAGILGAVMMSGVGAAALALGAVAIAGLGAALIPAAYAMKIFAESAPVFTDSIVRIIDAVGGFVTTVGNAISNILTSAGTALATVIGSITSLADIDVMKLIAVGAGLIAFSSSVLAFGVTMGLASIPILAGVGVLYLAAGAISTLGDALSTVQIPSFDLSGLVGLATIPIGDILVVGAGLLAFGGMMVGLGIMLSTASVPIMVGIGLLSVASVAVESFGKALSAVQIPTFDLSGLNGLAAIPVGDILVVGAGLLAFGGMMVGFSAMMATTSPLLLIASGVIAMVSTGVTLLSGSIVALNAAISSFDATPLQQLVSISATELVSVAVGIGAVSAAMLAFSAATAAGGVVRLFGNDVLKDLDRLANMADPLYLAAESIRNLAAGIGELGNVLNSVDLSGLAEVREVGKVSMERNLTEEISNRFDMPPMSAPESDAKVVPYEPKVPKAAPPRREAVAQNVRIVESVNQAVPDTEAKRIPASPVAAMEMSGGASGDTYVGGTSVSTKKIEFLLEDVKKLLEAIYRKPSDVKMDGYKVNKIIKSNNQ